MKIKSIDLKNFKFHHALSFEFNNNCLIYGENGTGKSSIYEALYTSFYTKKMISKSIDIREKYKNREFKEDSLEVSIEFSNNGILQRVDNSMENLELIENGNIFCANENVLNGLVKNNFYKVLTSTLIEHFLSLKDLQIYKTIEREILRKEIVKKEDIDSKLNSLNLEFKKLFYESIPIEEINNILQNNFQEDITIDLKITDAYKDETTFYNPQIKLTINNISDNEDLSNHFNEAKLKLIGISIYLALVKKYTTQSELKVLILDDFLTSLDMSNRKLIVQYIFDYFSDYQKIILTHNIQFFILIQKLLKSREELVNWDIKSLFYRNIDNSIETIIYDKETDYIKLSKSYIDNDKLPEAGNILRKEFERILEELRVVNEIGAKQKLSNIVEELLKLDSSVDINRKKMQSVLNKTKFYQQIVLHSASHENDTEIYKKECNGAITVLKELNKYIDILRKDT